MAEYIYIVGSNYHDEWSGIRLKPGIRGAPLTEWAKTNLSGCFTTDFAFSPDTPSLLQYTYWFSDPEAAIHFRLMYGGTVMKP